jgi:transposase
MEPSMSLQPYLPIRPTPIPRPGPRCDRAGSPSPARRSLIRSPAARPRAPAAGVHRLLTPSATADRNVVERCFNRLKQFRDLATRYAKRVAYYRSEIVIAAIVLWLRADLHDTP